MGASTTLTIGGSPIELARNLADATRMAVLNKLVAFARGSYPTLSFQRSAGTLPGLPDPWLAKPVTLTIDGTPAFAGDVVSVHPEYHPGFGWRATYQCLGLAHRADRIPHTDAGTGTDTSAFNLPPEDPLFDPARAGRTVGQVLAAVLTMPANGAALQAKGLGGLTYAPATGTYALPAATAGDLDALDVIPPAAVYVRGEKLLGAIAGVLAAWAPNHLLWVDPAGIVRVLDLRRCTPHTFVLGADPVAPGVLSRDWSDCFARVVVRGQPLAVMALLKLSQGDLTEDFAHDGLTTAQAKAQWSPGQWHQPGQAQDHGTCT